MKKYISIYPVPVVQNLPAIGEMAPPHPLESILPQDSDYEAQQEFRGFLLAGLNGIYLDNKKSVCQRLTQIAQKDCWGDEEKQVFILIFDEPVHQTPEKPSGPNFGSGEKTNQFGKSIHDWLKNHSVVHTEWREAGVEYVRAGIEMDTQHTSLSSAYRPGTEDIDENVASGTEGKASRTEGSTHQPNSKGVRLFPPLPTTICVLDGDTEQQPLMETSSEPDTSWSPAASTTEDERRERCCIVPGNQMEYQKQPKQP